MRPRYSLGSVWTVSLQIKVAGTVQQCDIRSARTWYHVYFPDMGVTIKVNPEAKNRNGVDVRWHPVDISRKAVEAIDSLPLKRAVPVLRYASRVGASNEEARYACTKLGIDIPAACPRIPLAVWEELRAKVASLGK